MQGWKRYMIYCMFVLLERTSLKNIKTHKTSVSVVFCYILECKNWNKKPLRNFSSKFRQETSQRPKSSFLLKKRVDNVYNNICKNFLLCKSFLHIFVQFFNSIFDHWFKKVFLCKNIFTPYFQKRGVFMTSWFFI